MNHPSPYPPGCSGPPEPTWEEDLREHIEDDESRLAAVLTRSYDAETLAETLIGIRAVTGRLDARDEYAAGVLDHLHEMVRKALDAEVKSVKWEMAADAYDRRHGYEGD